MLVGFSAAEVCWVCGVFLFLKSFQAYPEYFRLGQAGEGLQHLTSAVPDGLGVFGCKGLVQTAIKSGTVFRTQAGV